MTIKDRISLVERPSAVKRLDAASAEQARLRDHREAAKGTHDELAASVWLRAADEQVEARERWLQWVDEGDY
jgi:hypothetical protein